MEMHELKTNDEIPENMTEILEERETEELLENHETEEISERETEKRTEEQESEKISKERDAQKFEKLSKLPVSRIKHIMKMDPEALHSTQEAVFLITKATELFVGSLASEAYKQAAQAKRKTIQKKDINAAIDCIDSLAFLEGVLD